MKKLLLGSILAFALSLNALADQCAWIDSADQAHVWRSAEKLLKASDDFIFYCEPCGGLTYQQPGSKFRSGIINHTRNVQVGQATAGTGTSRYPEYMQFTLNGEAVDIAYIYVRTASRVFTNLALLTGCPASDVPPVMYTAPGKRAAPVTYQELASGNRSPQSVKETPKKKDTKAH